MTADKKPLPAIPAKRYFTIGEVSELCGVKAYVLRYWEQEFTQLKPMKRRGNRRYYQHHEVLLIRRIRDLLYEQGFTISGARNQLADAAHAHAHAHGAPPQALPDDADHAAEAARAEFDAYTLDEAALAALAAEDDAVIAQAGLALDARAEPPARAVAGHRGREREAEPAAPAAAAGTRARNSVSATRAAQAADPLASVPHLREELLAIRALLVG